MFVVTILDSNIQDTTAGEIAAAFNSDEARVKIFTRMSLITESEAKVGELATYFAKVGRPIIIQPVDNVSEDLFLSDT